MSVSQAKTQRESHLSALVQLVGRQRALSSSSKECVDLHRRQMRSSARQSHLRMVNLLTHTICVCKRFAKKLLNAAGRYS